MLHGGIANAGAVVRVGAHVLRPSNAHTDDDPRLPALPARAGLHRRAEPGRHRRRRARAAGVHRRRGAAAAVPGVGAVRRVAGLGRPAAAPVPRGRARLPLAGRRDVEPGDGRPGRAARPVDDRRLPQRRVPGERRVPRRHRRGAARLRLRRARRPAYDLSQFARMCVPIDDESRVRFGWRPADLGERLRLVADSYGLRRCRPRRAVRRARPTASPGGEFVRRRVEAGDANFIEMWESMGGMARFDRRRAWFAAHAARFRDALG